MSGTNLTYDVDDANFEERVLAASHQLPVVVDFWAEWCAPCRALAPLLAKLVAEYGGRFVLAKVNTERAQQLARDHGIRSIPTVKIFKDGVVVEEFLGLLPESSLRVLLDRHVPRSSDAQREQAETLLAGGDSAGAIALLQATLAEDPENPRLRFALAEALLKSGELDAAEQALTGLNAEQRDSAVHKRILARIAFARAAGDDTDPNDLEELLKADPGDCAAHYRLGAWCALNGDFDRAADEFLEIMRRDRRYQDEAARKALLALFELLDRQDRRLPEYRARMGALLH